MPRLVLEEKNRNSTSSHIFAVLSATVDFLNAIVWGILIIGIVAVIFGIILSSGFGYLIFAFGVIPIIFLPAGQLYKYYWDEKIIRRRLNFKKLSEIKRIKIQKFPYDENYLVIKKFVKKYKGCDVNSTHFENVELLLRDKGIGISRSDLIMLINYELNLLEYEEFKDRVLSNNPQSIEELLKNLILLQSEDYHDYLNYLNMLLLSKGHKIRESVLISKIEEIKYRFKIENLEKHLTESKPDFQIGDINFMSGYEFEDFLGKLFKRMGYKVDQTNYSNDQGADLIISRLGKRYVVQAKNFSKNVGNKSVQEVVAAVKHYDAHSGIVVATSNFTKSAIELADSNQVKLIDRNELNKLIQKYLSL